MMRRREESNMINTKKTNQSTERRSGTNKKTTDRNRDSKSRTTTNKKTSSRNTSRKSTTSRNTDRGQARSKQTTYEKTTNTKKEPKKSNNRRKSSPSMTNKTLYKNTGVERAQRFKIRIAIVGVCLMATLIILIGRIGYYAIVKGEDFEREVYARMMSSEEEVEGLRGKILDTNHKVIANSELVYHIILDPKSLLNNKIKESVREKTYTVLAEYLGKSTADIAKIVSDNKDTHYKILKKSISAEDMEMLKSTGIKGIWFEESFIRTYPKNELAAQTLGFYNGTKGQYGIEQQYDTHMQGTAGRVFPKIQDGNIITIESVPAKEGNTVILTIDEVVQQYVEQVMDKYVETYDPLYAAALIMNPNTGEIYSMYTSPGFNPNTYASLEEQLGKEAWEAMTLEEKNAMLGDVWQNYNTQHPYEPGSTFKPMMVAAALEEGILDGSEIYNCTGNNHVAGTNIQCWKRSGHGIQTLEQALANSCNTAVIEMAAEMPTDMFQEYMVRYGLGVPTGIDLPAEASGIIHSKSGLGPVEKATASMGQGFTLTPMQLMSAFSSVINGGKLVTPYIVSQVVDEENQIVMEHSYGVNRQVISEETSDIVRQYLHSVVDYGTGTAAAIDGYVMGGKTGTAQKLPREDNEHIYSFVGYAPLEQPEIIALVLFDEIEEESGVPTKAYAEIMSKVLPYMGIESVDTPDIVSTDRVITPSVADLDLHKGIEMLYAEELEYETIGIGTQIVDQYPKAGTKLPKGSQVKIYLETQTPESVHTVPNVVGMSIADAVKLTNGFFELEGPETGIVTEQIPRAGTKIEINSKIIVQTSQ